MSHRLSTRRGRGRDTRASRGGDNVFPANYALLAEALQQKHGWAWIKLTTIPGR